MAKTSRSPNELLREPRLGRGWSLDRMADQLRRLAFRLGEPEPGVDGNMISRWERGLHRPGPSKRLRTSLSSMAELGMRSICASQVGRWPHLPLRSSSP
jgi:hypothetical protein